MVGVGSGSVGVVIVVGVAAVIVVGREVFLVPSPHVLEPNLGDSLG